MEGFPIVLFCFVYDYGLWSEDPSGDCNAPGKMHRGWCTEGDAPGMVHRGRCSFQSVFLRNVPNLRVFEALRVYQILVLQFKYFNMLHLPCYQLLLKFSIPPRSCKFISLWRNIPTQLKWKQVKIYVSFLSKIAWHISFNIQLKCFLFQVVLWGQHQKELSAMFPIPSQPWAR